ncbi:histidine phosphatase family protein [Loktanella sp. IMCC34160]|uniref:histidine phosphatase family protein n=1 Tax=Loktanella sp. IMCC34160 TaxID=2510646 RepID=UPI00101D0AA4|nr:histidine phosphatase family protein [Loktanella sp. IMCC34160]RYG92015.1 histidine phosphatase family protein [Loktanella sp. IMCC34160]
MSLPEIIIARHGQTEWNRAGRWQGGLDSPLTAKGEDQARGLGEILVREGIGPDGWNFLTSPQGRSVDTARIALVGIGATAQVVHDLREIDVGTWAGLTVDEIDSRWPGPEDERFIDKYTRAPGGESFDALWDRAGVILGSLNRPTVLFTHGMTSRFLRTRALGMSLADLMDVPGGQGCLFRIRDGAHEVLWP